MKAVDLGWVIILPEGPHWVLDPNKPAGQVVWKTNTPKLGFKIN